MKAIIYVHGKDGSYLETEQYKKNCDGYDIVGVDYNDYLPWIVQDQIKAAYKNLTKEYEHISYCKQYRCLFRNARTTKLCN